ncbi:MAG: hypothetical protein ACE5LV_07575 [Candidatus Aminicenantales bacterium]
MVHDRRTIERELRVDINRKAVHSLLGYRKGQTAWTQEMATLLQRTYSEALDLVEPVGVYIVRRIREKDDEIRFFRTKTRIKSRSIRMLFHKATAAVFLAVTIGPKLEEKIQEETAKGRNEKALVLDAIGSEAVEAAADSLNTHLVSLARQTRHFLTTRFSPGYGDLPLSFQQDLYRELSLRDIGVRINEKHILFPQKTITAVIGVEP